jgi:hypothetical protein
LLVLTLVGCERIDLSQLVLEQPELALALSGELAQAVHALLQQLRLRVGLRACPQVLVVPCGAQRVEDLQLGAGQRELAVLVLSVEGEQRAADVAQLSDRGRAPAEVGARAPIGADTTREHDLLGVGTQALAELLAHTLGQIEDPLDVSLASSRPHDPRPRAPAEEQVERVREHRLASAGLAGEHVQPRGQPQLSLLNQQEVLYTKLLQHSRWSTSARGQIA